MMVASSSVELCSPVIKMELMNIVLQLIHVMMSPDLDNFKLGDASTKDGIK